MSYDFHAKIDTVADDFGLPDNVRNTAYKLSDDMKGRDNFLRKFMLYGGFDAVVGFIVYTAADQERYPMEIGDIVEYMHESEMFSVTKHFHEKKFREAVRKIRREFELPNTVYDPEEYLKHFRGGLGIDNEEEVWDYARELVSSFKKERGDEGLTGKSPKAVAAAAVYIVSVLRGNGITQKQVQDLFGVSEVAIRYTYKQILEEVAGIDTEDTKLKDLRISLKTLRID